MNIVKYPNEILEKKCETIENIEEVKEILLEMKAYVQNPANRAAGLALPQVGINKCGFVAKIGKKVKIFINPREIQFSSSEKLSENEGCLSIPGQTVSVLRHKKINKLKYTDINGKEKSMSIANFDDARVFQHEYDHLNGKLIISNNTESNKKVS